MRISGWGRYPSCETRLHLPAHQRQVVSTLRDRFDGIPRGAARSYGDSALAAEVLSSRELDQFLAWDSEQGLLRCGAGLRLHEILSHFVPRGWFLPVLPGTGEVTVGGAIAADIHGKNHHLDGCFSAHVESLVLIDANGEMVHCSAQQNRELFRATCGGMGLTGFILEAGLRLRPVRGPWIRQTSLRTENLEQSFRALKEHDTAHYSVAWLDCMASGNKTGRSVLFLGEHSEHGDADRDTTPKRRLSVPCNSPSMFLNRYSMTAFNQAYYHLAGEKAESRQHYRDYFFPLDRISDWNRLYGKRGFLQYQFVMPEESALAGIRRVLQKTRQAGKGSFLSVLKRLGPENDNLLSFPRTGYTLALDFKYQRDLPLLLDSLDAVVMDHDGRLYLAKDARMPREVFRRGYPGWKAFRQLREDSGAQQCFNSLQSRRLGL